MAYIIAVTGAVTSAARLSKELERSGCVNSRVIHTPEPVRKGGCSYSVKIPDTCLTLLSDIISEKHFRLKKIYRETIKNGERSYDDLS